MRKLKKIKLTPVSQIQLGIDIKIVESRDISITHLSPEKQEEFFRKVNKWVKDHKSKGVIMTKSVNDEPTAISTQLNTAANKKNVLSFQEPNLVRIYYSIANQNFEYALNLKKKFSKLAV